MPEGGRRDGGGRPSYWRARAAKRLQPAGRRGLTLVRPLEICESRRERSALLSFIGIGSWPWAGRRNGVRLRHVVGAETRGQGLRAWPQHRRYAQARAAGFPAEIRSAHHSFRYAILDETLLRTDQNGGPQEASARHHQRDDDCRVPHRGRSMSETQHYQHDAFDDTALRARGAGSVRPCALSATRAASASSPT